MPSLVSQASVAQNIVSSDSFALNCSGANFLTVEICAEDGGSGNPAVSAIAYAGVAMTLAYKYKSPVSSDTCFVYYLANPASGSNNVTVTYGGNTNRSIWATSFSGMPSPTLNVIATSTANGVTSHVGTIVTTEANELVITCHYGSRPITSFSSSDFTRATPHAGNNYGAASYDDGGNSAGSKSYTITYGSAGFGIELLVSFIPSASDPGDGDFLSFM